MKLRELSDESKSKSHGNVARSTSAYGDNKYVWFGHCVFYQQLTRSLSGNSLIEPAVFVIHVAWQHDVMLV